MSINLLTEKFISQSGNPPQMEAITHSAAIIIKDKKALLVKRPQDDVEGDKWTFVNETLEQGETPEQAVVRGVKEEIGCDFEIIHKLFEHEFKGHKTHVFLGTIQGDIRINPKEVLKAGWAVYEEATSLAYAFGYEQVLNRLRQLQLI
ncbi:NUDIX domain-containing protein [Candidatus Woesearchaeota archaeon]|nr:NUDIX domain-containing protein [Candidatus Woesearchaeota archaeon]